jgi:hypothetical protein
VFGMGTGVAPTLSVGGKSLCNCGSCYTSYLVNSGKMLGKNIIWSSTETVNTLFDLFDFFVWLVTAQKSGQADRPISTGQLNVLLHLHLRPINVVVFHGPDGDI